MRPQSAACLWILPLAAAGLLPAPAAAEPGELLLELFTSQGCHSCPPAERLFAASYADRPGLLALEMHVDYWDDLVYGAAGSWQDPFSDPAFTARQRRYAASFGRGGVYTPQAVVQGAYGMSGTAGQLIDSALERLAAADFSFGWEIDYFDSAAAGGWQARVEAGSGRAEAYLAVFRDRAVTAVAAGENKGRQLVNRNIVTGWQPLGEVAAGTSLEVAAPGPGHGCAVILQRPGAGAALGAWRCPE